MAPEEEPIKQELPGITQKPEYDGANTIPLEVPERFRDGDDADDDCTALSGVNGYMNQSVFGMIAAAGSQVNFDTRFDAQSSDDEVDDPSRKGVAQQVDNRTTKKGRLARPRIHRKRISRTILRSLHGISSKSKLKQTSIESDDQSSSQLKSLALAPRVPATTYSKPSSPTIHVGTEMPLQSSLSNADTDNMNNDNNNENVSDIEDLSKKLMEIFQFESIEKVIEEYPCWLMKSVLLQGHMYITVKHICFYAYLPKKSNEVVKSGYLSKSGRRNPKFNRYLFRLKGDVLTYYTDPSDLYFPRGNIDLRNGISANLSSKESQKDATYFTIVTSQREYNFKADSVPSAKEWVKALQKIIFRSHNEGDSVKISLPIENILDIEESQMVDFAETFRIRVVDNGDTYAVDEYFFSFFSFGKEALSLLRNLVEDSTAHQIHEELVETFSGDKIMGSPKLSSIYSIKDSKILSPLSLNISGSLLLEESVKATLTPPGATSPRVSAEMRRKSSDICRKSFDFKNLGRRSLDLNRMSAQNMGKSSMTGSFNDANKTRNSKQNIVKNNKSVELHVQSIGVPESLSMNLRNSDETHASGSQILKGSDVFLSPTIQHASSTAVPNESNTNMTDKLFGLNLNLAPEKKDQKNPEPAAGSCSGRTEPSVSTPTLQNFVKVGTYPIQRAAGFAEYLNKHSKRMSNLLATESMGYVEKVSGMWKGGKRHYDESNRIGPEDLYAGGEDEDIVGSGERFRDHFALPETEKLQAAYFGFLNRVLPLYGKIYISDRSFCFRSLLPGTNTKLILPLKDIENVDKEKGFRFGYSGLVVVIKAHEELFFEFSHSDIRDDCAVTLLQNLETLRYLHESGLLMTEEMESAESAAAELKALQQARLKDYDDHDLLGHKKQGLKIDASSIVFDDPRASILNFKPAEPLCITCLTIGSRGDVQPYIALCKGLISEGHHTRIATHLEFKEWVEGHGIEFRPVSGDPAELMRICIENGMFTYSFLKEASSKFRGWIDELLVSAWEACQGSNLLIESPSAMGGIHIAEALAIPYFRAFTMPWTRTRAYPHAFAVPEHKMGGAYNYMTYVMFDNLFWKAIAGQVNRWRKKHLNLNSTNLEKMQPNKVPFLYNFSPAVVVPPLDYSDWIRVTGYWFLDEGSDWTPPKELIDFIAKAKTDEKKLVYVGFGSIVVQDSAALMNTIIKSVEKADVRCILSRGWSDRLDKQDVEKKEPCLPESILQIRSAPHDWLFKQIDAAAHHGGAGTTGASLRAGIPTIIKPFFGDQYFFGSRVEDLGVGIAMKKLNVSVFSRALWQACNDERMIIKAKILGKTIREENGVSFAIQSIYRDLEYANSLIKRSGVKASDELVEDSEESWTFVSEENDPVLVRRIRDWESMNKPCSLTHNQADSNDSDGSTIRKELERAIGVKGIVN